MKAQPTEPFTKKDVLALLTLAAGFVALLAGTWQRWTQPLIDHGREMNLPARIATGEQLYVDVQFLYGPLAPYVNATLYQIFGVHLAVLKTAGAVCAAIILFLLYGIARRLMTVWEAVATTALVMTICAIKSTGNYIQPYAYAALYALVFSLGSLAATLTWLKQRTEFGAEGGAIADGFLPKGDFVDARSPARLVPNPRWWFALAGVLSGLALIAKPEMALAALAGGGTAWLIASLIARRVLWRDGVSFALPAIVIFVGTWAVLLRRVPWRFLLAENHILFYTMPPPLLYFNRYISGLGAWPRSGWFTVAGLGVFAIWIGGSILLGAVLKKWAMGSGQWAVQESSRVEQLPTGLLGLALLVIGSAWQWAAVDFGRVKGDPTPFASAVIVLPILIGALGWRLWRAGQEVSWRNAALLVVSVFALVAILRAIVNVTIAGPYTPFFLPVVILVYLYVLFRVAPELLLRHRNPADHVAARRVAITLVLLMAIGLGINSVQRLHRSSKFEVATARGSFLTEPEYGQPLAEAIRYAQTHTRPGEYVLTLPQATTINFLADRPYPLREEIVHPGFLADAREEATIERIKAKRIPLIFVAYLETSEFGAPWFGESYNQKLLAWIKATYRQTARFEYAARSSVPLDKRPFYIEAYELRGGME